MARAARAYETLERVARDRPLMSYVDEATSGGERKLGAVRAKMHCQSFETRQYGPTEESKTVKVNLGAIYGKEGENADFAKATPSGACWMQIDAGVPASRFFTPGKSYYVTFTEAPD